MCLQGYPSCANLSDMNECLSTKKTAAQNWHSADIVAELRKAGWSLRRLATHHGYASPTTLATALHRPWPKGERIIAEAIGLQAAEIWPERHRQRIAPGRRAVGRADVRAGDSIHETASAEAGAS